MQLANPLDTSDSLYLEPHLLLYPNLDEWKKPKEGTDYYFRIATREGLNFDSLLSEKRIFVVAEPGYGKSKLINEIIKSLDSSEFLKLEAKDIKGNSIEETAPHVNIGEKKYLLIDALDEVEAKYTASTIQSIEAFEEKHPDLTLLITCRRHYIQGFERMFKRLSAYKFIQISPLYESDIRRYLEHYLPGEEETIARLINKVRTDRNTSILSTPRYLEALVRAIEMDLITIQELPSLKLTMLFDRLIYHKLNEEVAVNSLQFSKNEADLTRRVLEKISLIMEIFQTNAITKEDLITILDDSVSNVNLIFLNYSSIDIFIERILKQTGDWLELEHTEFQEYLAAKQLVRLANREQALYDLIMDQNLQYIYASWYDVLKYAVELSPGILINLVSYLAGKKNSQVDGKLIDILLKVDLSVLTEEDCGVFFWTLAGYYQRSGQYIGRGYHEISRFFSRRLNGDYLTIGNEPQIPFSYSNRIHIIRGLVENKQLKDPEKANWKSLLLERLQDTCFDSVIQSTTFVLEVFNAFDDLRALWPEIQKRHNDVIENYLVTLFRIDPSNEFCLEALLDVIKAEIAVDNPDLINMLRGKKNLKGFFEFILAKPSNLELALGKGSTYKEFHHFFIDLEALADEELDKMAGSILGSLLNVNDFYHLYGPKRQFADRAMAYLLKTKETALNDLLNFKSPDRLVHEFGSVFADSMNFEQFEAIRTMLIREGADWELRSIIAKLKVLGDISRQELLSQIEQAYPELFEVANPQPVAARPDSIEEDIKYNELSGYLALLNQDRIYQDIFPFINNNYELFVARFDEVQINKVIGLLERTLERLSPDGFILNINRVGNRSQYDYISPDWFRYNTLIKLALKMGINDVAKRFRKKILLQLPLIDNYYSNASEMSAIVDLIRPVNRNEVDEMVAYWLTRKDDYLFHNVTGLSDMIQESGEPGFSPILELYLATPLGKVDLNEKAKALNAYAIVTKGTNDGKLYLQQFFENQSQAGGSGYLRQLANGYLVSFYEDDASVTWRFNQLKTNIYTVDENSRQTSFNSYNDPHIIEMDQPTYGKCFSDYPSMKFEAPMFELLEFSFALLKEPKHRRYAAYLQTMIFQYFDKVNSLPLINKISGFLSEKRFEESSYSFKFHLRQLEANFIDTNRHFDNIAEAVQYYNSLVAKRYVKVRDVGELIELIVTAIDTDLRNMIENEGYYHFIQRLAGNIDYGTSQFVNEDVLQRTIKLMLENSLFARGLRDVDVYREPELADAKRYDYLIKYGFVGPVVVEIKRLHNEEIKNDAKRADYKSKIIQYINSVPGRVGIYLVVKVKPNENGGDLKAYEKLIEEYKNIKGLKIMYLDCWKPIEALVVKQAVANKATAQATKKNKTTTKKSGQGQRKEKQ